MKNAILVTLVVFAIVIAIITIIAIVAYKTKRFSFYEVFLSEQEKYDKYLKVIESKPKSEGPQSKKRKPTPATAETLALTAAIKKKIEEQYGQFMFLHWSKFKSVRVMEASIGNDTYGLYFPESNILYINKNLISEHFSSTRLKKEITHVLAHELIHSLTCSRANATDIYCEGFVEYLAHQIYPTDCKPYKYTYIFAEAYVDNYGIEKALRDYLSGTAMKDLGAKTNLPEAADNLRVLVRILSEPHKSKDRTAADRAVILEVYLKYIDATQAEVSKTALELFEHLSARKDCSKLILMYLSSLTSKVKKLY